MPLINGDDYVSGDIESYQQNNRLKNHWRDNIADLTNPSLGMIKSDPAGDILSHRISGPAWSVILQGGVNSIISDDIQLIGGDNTDAILIPYEEATNDAVIWGLPVSPKRGLIFCDVADIAGDFSALITASTHPMISIVDLDIDSYVTFGYAADDMPDIWSNRVLNLQYEGIAGVDFFAGADVGENQPVRIFGWNTAGGDLESISFIMDDANDEFLIQAPNSVNHEGITVDLLETNQRFRIRQNSDILSWYLTATDAFMRWSDGTLILMTDETDTPTIVRLMPNGTSEVSEIELYDTDGERLSIYTAADRAYIESIGGILGINPSAAQDIKLFEYAVIGQNPYFFVYGGTPLGVKYWRIFVGTAGHSLFEAEEDFYLKAQGVASSQMHISTSTVRLADDVSFNWGAGYDYSIVFNTTTNLLEGSDAGTCTGASLEYFDTVIKATVNFDDTSPTAICTVADGWIVTDVWVEITTIWDGNGTIEIGDGVDPNGFLDDANINQGVAGLYGLDENARGAYLNNSIQKEYTGADTVDATLVVGTSTQGVAVVYVHMTRIK